ncbi:triphosphoribosyl-dephospho-CoA synthase [Singulisphaera sp. PoT]|uniref:triphosphoribosyl-dephospho-CoA synthase n=1 Tax=Singulisphaera sp. PoT TaxID=3411797 RepID=UPI003BF60F32
MTTKGLSPGQVAQIACILEVSARKPGNVHPGRAFEDIDFLDFLLSASAIANPLDLAREQGVGASIFEAVRATRRVVASNTNLGMILLLAPLAAVPEGEPLREGVGRILAGTTLADASLVYKAIRLAQPGGLQTASEQDVADEPTVTLVEAMRLAADRDLIARQYALDYVDIFDLACPALRRSLEAGHPLETAITSCFLALLAKYPDSLIARKRGLAEAEEASRKASEVLAGGWPDSTAGPRLLREFDAWLRTEGHSRNPGTSADLVSAALFVALMDGTISMPRTLGPSSWSRAASDDKSGFADA